MLINFCKNSGITYNDEDFRDDETYYVSNNGF